MPALHDESGEATFDACVASIADAIDSADEVIVVGHSGAGVLLPFATALAKQRQVGYVFVDAGLPPLRGSTLDHPPVLKAAGIAWSRQRSFADRVEPDGFLPPWDTWWGADGMAGLVPDDERRVVVTGDIGRLPLSFYAQGGEVPPEWASAPAGYVLLSDVYRVWADAARSYGWPVEEVPGTHLELVNRPEAVASAIERLVSGFAGRR